MKVTHRSKEPPPSRILPVRGDEFENSRYDDTGAVRQNARKPIQCERFGKLVRRKYGHDKPERGWDQSCAGDSGDRSDNKERVPIGEKRNYDIK